MSLQRREEFLTLLNRHRELAELTAPALARDLRDAYDADVGLSLRDLGRAVGLNKTTVANRINEAVAPPPLEPGLRLRVPLQAMDPYDPPGPDHVVAQALAQQCLRLTGWLPPPTWAAAQIEAHLDAVLQPRMPPRHYFGLAEEPDPTGDWLYGIFPQ